MAGNVVSARGKSNSKRVNVDGRNRQTCRSKVRELTWFDPVLRELQGLFSQKLAMELAVRTGRDKRVCEKWIARDCDPDGGAVRSLIQSDVGDRVVLALSRGSSAAWVKTYRRQHESAQLRSTLRETQRRLDAIERDLADDR